MSKIPYCVKNSILFTITLICFQCLHAQNLATTDKKNLQRKEDSLKSLAKIFMTDNGAASRMRADSLFIKTLVRALKIKGSFYYPFQNVLGVSKLYAPDSSFRIFTWSLQIDEDHSRKRGAIQVRTSDSSLNLIPLTDYSQFTPQPTDSVRNKLNWIGAVYYDIIKTEYKGLKYYTLLGIDNTGLRTTKKWVEVLSFDDNGEPLFGQANFSFKNDSIPSSDRFRFSLEYKKYAPVILRFDTQLNMIVFDELLSEDDQPENKYTFIPDGYFEGFRWEDGKWVHISNAVFTLKLKNGEFPMPQRLKDDNGNNDEHRLWEQSVKNESNKTNEKKKRKRN